MPRSRAELLTAHFYDWEKRGRGWYVFDNPVELEPEFAPFFPYVLPTSFADESLRPNLVGRAANFLKTALRESAEEVTEEPTESVVQGYYSNSDENIRAISLSFPQGEKAPKAQDIEKFLTMLSYTQSTVCFEIIASPDAIRIQFVCREPDILHVESQVKAYFPYCIMQQHEVNLGNTFNEEAYYAVVDYGLEEECMRPLLMADKFDTDPLTGLYGILDHLKDGEQAIIQILFKGTVNPWARSIYSSVSDAQGDSFFSDAPEMPKLAQEKISAPLFAVGVRVFCQAASTESAVRILERVGTALMQNSNSGFNKLIPLAGATYTAELHAHDVVFRQTRRAGMLLNAKELATFVHYPVSVTSKKLRQDKGKTKRAPDIAWGHEFCLGTNSHQGFEGIVTLESKQRLKHMHVIGATGTGKSTMLQSCIAQDILLGNGVAVLDPHGDLIESVLPYIPESRYDDVILIDPADSEFPVGFNILSAHSDVEKEILASDLVSVFRRLSTSFGDQMHSVLANAILAFVESNEGGTLIDLRRFLIEKPFREHFLKTVSDPNIVYYWQKEFPILKSNSIGPILTRLDSFLRPKLIRNMVAQKKSLDFEAIMDSKKILLIKLSQGLIGIENSYLLGTFFVSKIYQAAMARQTKSKEDRTPFYMYVDEFQNFITPSMSSILSGTRKYGLGCILAHQDMSQLQKYDAELGNAVVSNAGTRVCFRIGDIDAKRFTDGFSSFEAQDIQNLGVGQAICRIERPEYDFTISTLQLKDLELEQAEEVKNVVISSSREKYGTAKKEVEQSLEYLREQKVQEVVIEPQKKQVITPPVKEEVQEITEPETKGIVKPVEITDGKTKEILIKQKELSEHRYLQTYIKKMAEARGYTAKIEEPTPDGNGRVDVSLERNGKRIACEIGMTTTTEWELHNIEKCLVAGYDLVVAIAKSKDLVSVMQEEIKTNIDAPLLDKVMVMEAESLFAYLDAEMVKEATTETRIKGYRVKVEYSNISEQEMNMKRNSVTKAVVDSMKKKKKD
jgi:hypothetical protein